MLNYCNIIFGVIVFVHVPREISARTKENIRMQPKVSTAICGHHAAKGGKSDVTGQVYDMFEKALRTLRPLVDQRAVKSANGWAEPSD